MNACGVLPVEQPWVMILSSETNKVFFSAHLKADYPIFFKRIKDTLEQYSITVELLQDTEDYWCRDYMPIQVGEHRFVKYNYCPDYLNKQSKRRYITKVEHPLSHLEMDRETLVDMSDIIVDGGNVVKTPYHIIMTEKVFIENSHFNHLTLISRLEDTFQSEAIIIPWGYRRKDPCGHTDGMVRYIKDKELLMDNYEHFSPRIGKRIHEILKEKGYTVHELNLPYGYNESWAYINFLQTASVIIIPKFGLIADKYAYQHLCSIFDVPIVQMPAPNIIKKYGGAFNCMSWNIKV